MKALALLTGLALRPNMQRAAVGIEVAHPKSGEVTITGTSLKSRANQQAEIRICRVEKALALGEREITRPRLVHVLERLYPSPLDI